MTPAMAGIPPVLDTDAEDVAWALQTAEALWKRNERVDAIVWLRRAAQSAGEAEDDDRALALARDAAELTDWMAQNPAPGAAPSHPAAAPTPSTAPTAAAAVDDLLRSSQADEYEIRVSAVPPESLQPESMAIESVREPADEEVPSAAEQHAGMLDPWAEADAPKKARGVAARGVAGPPLEPEEVVTSAPPIERPAGPKPPPPPPPRPPPPTPPSAAPPPPPPAAKPPPVPPPVPRRPPPAPTRASVLPTAAASKGVDLSGVEALADLPDDERDAFAKGATVQALSREEEVSGFALAFVLEGQVDVAATIVDAPALRLGAGQVLRARGTVDHVTPLRLIAASESARVAVWSEMDVEHAFRTCPWVEDELRASGDRVQAEVGLTLGPLGERVDWGLRVDLASRLELRILAEHEACVTSGLPVPALMVVGAGELELLDDDGNPTGDTLLAGDFVFASEILTAAPAPNGVRAAKGGALLLQAERSAAQELLVTCPPLLEIFTSS